MRNKATLAYAATAAILAIIAASLLIADQRTSMVVVDTSKPLASFDPNLALGAGIDGHEKGEIRTLLSPSHIAAMRSAGLKPLTYRLRTELAVEAWHWNSRGTWSDPLHAQGYWTSSAVPGALIDVSYGYRLPRRGNTIDQANNDGYSRITDGDRGSFWKSNPYLAPMPQWVVVDLGKRMPLDTVRIAWGNPWATRYRIQYSVRDDLSVTAVDLWRDLPEPDHRAPVGGEVTSRFAPAPVLIRRFRILMEASSSKGVPHVDWRDHAGFAVREIEAGTMDGAGRLHDVVRHASNRAGQSVVWVSSTDPWHRASDRDEQIEQPGFDRVFRGGLTNGLPMLTPAPILYDTPENAVAEAEFLGARGYAVNEMELGEEPEEQEIPPEMYAMLYRKWATALHQFNPKMRIGGPSLVLLAPESQDHPGQGKTSWISRWIADMRKSDAMRLVQFFSFEWYAFDDVCAPVAPQLGRAAELFRNSLDELLQDGVPRGIPWFMTEYGYSAYGARAEVDLPGAIFNAETVATFFAFGGAKAYLYGYEPGELLSEKPCAGAWGNNLMLLSGPPLRRMPAYYGAKLVSQEWLMASGGRHTMYRATVDNPQVGAYAVTRPDQLLSILLVNKDPSKPVKVRVPMGRNMEARQYSRSQYEWHAAGEYGRPLRNLPPAKVEVQRDGLVVLPPYSITVVRGLAPGVP